MQPREDFGRSTYLLPFVRCGDRSVAIAYRGKTTEPAWTEIFVEFCVVLICPIRDP
jgi:hypothetical protein